MTHVISKVDDMPQLNLYLETVSRNKQGILCILHYFVSNA